MAFYLNLHNLMMVHLILHLRQLGVKEYSLNDFEFYMHRRRFCYSVGQLGPVSLYDVRTQLLKVRDCSATKSGRKFEETRRISWVPRSDSYSLNTTSGNQMLLFGLIDGFISSVPLQVYTELNVVQELTSNLEFIIKRTLTKFSETNHIHLPEFLHLYSVVFTGSRSSNTPADTLSVASSSADTGHSSCDSDEDLLTFLISHCSSELQAEASVLQNREDKDGIVWTATHSTLGVSTSLLHFTYSDELQRTLTNNGAAPQTAPPQSSSSPSSSDRFAMTDSALDFIFESSPLLATLLLLVVGDDVETRRETPVPMPLTDTGITGDNPPDKLQEEGPENIYSTMLNIRSYRYERLAREFLTLGQWIRCYWCRLKSSSSRSLSDPLMEFCSNLPPKSIILSLLSHPHSNEFHKALESHLLSLYQSGSWEDIFSTIKSLPRIVTNATPAPAIIRPIRDFALRQLLLNMSESNADSKKRLLWLFYLSESTDILNGDFLARCLPLLEARQALELLERCSATLKKIPETECKMSDILDHYIPRMRVYSEIADMIRSHDSPITRASSPYELIYWPKLEDVSESYPEFVLQQLLKWKAFPLASKWSAIFLPETGLQEIEAAYLESLVENDNVMNSVEFLQRLFHTLHNFPDGGPKFVWQVCVNIAQNFSNSSPLAVQLASGFALKHVLSLLEEGRPPESGLLLSRAFVGASMLRALPSFTIRDMYQHLMLTPHLIVEQLIMNLQIELCKQLLEQYRIQRGPVSLHYASDPQGDSFSEPTSPCPYSHSPGSIEYLPLSRIPELEPSAINQLLITYARKAVKLGAVRLEEQDSSQLLRTEDLSLQTIRSNMLRRHSSFVSEDETSDFTSTVCSPSADPLEATTTPNEEHFIMPRVPIPRENWVPDEQTNLCMCCRNERFSMFNRRHHCRQCGRVVCATCSENRHIINNMSSRVCKHCYIELTRLAAASPCPTMQSMKSATSDFLAPLRPRQATVIGFVDDGWRLSKEEEENEAIRQDFNFEQTPSITLCLSLLDLHSNSNDCGQSILELCDYLSSFLTPGKDNRPNPEVDYPLVISIIRHLLYKAKLKFSRVSNSDATLRCDVYLSQLDLLHVLIQSNYRKLPSLTQLTRKDQVGAFRDRLIQSERLELAMEVSTKAGLQCAPVWSAMALRSLESGDYAEARSYMKRCLSPPKDKNSFVPLQGPLNDVIKLLEGRRPSGVLISDILSFAEGLNNLLDEPEKRIRDDATMNRETLEECMFYLETYASHFHFLQFLVRHNYWNKAVTHARDMKVSPDVFVESLVAPSLLMGKFKTLRDQMVMLDSSLKIWAPYMERICMHLEKNGYVEDLYNIQVLTHDHLRAAITCIYQFFLKGASTYVELNNRIAHLKTSSQHLENALKDALRSKDTTQSDKIRRYIKVVKMQEEGTRFLAQPACIKYMTSAYAYKTKGLPTLFSEDGNSKVEFCLVIIFSSAVLLDGLTTACRIINECHMKAVPILSRAGYHLLSLMRANLPEAESSLRELVQEMRGLCYVMDSDDSDKIIFSILSRMTDAEKKGATAEEFIKRIVSKDTKINAYLLTSRFRPAYLLAVQLNNQQHIEKIAEEAEKSGDTQIAEICKKRIREMKASQSEI